MNKEERINEIQRMIYIENIISIEKKNYIKSEIDLETIIFKITSEYNIQLNEKEKDYFYRAYLIPFDEIKESIKVYDESKPKMDELKFVMDLQNKYNVNKEIIIERIKDIRWIEKVFKSKQTFEILAMPKNTSYILNKDDIKKNSKKDYVFISELANEFKKNNLKENKLTLNRTKK